MSSNEHGETILRELGLTFSQAKVYIALIRIRKDATVNEISIFSNIARQDIYRILGELQRIGIIEKIVATPTLFKAIPAKEAASVLIDRRNRKTLVLQKESIEVFNHFPENASSTMQPRGQQFILIPRGEVLFHRIERAIKATTKTIWAITPWREFTQWSFSMGELYKSAVERGATIRWITETPQDSDSPLQTAPILLDNPSFKLRTTSASSEERLGVYDSREMFIATTKDPNAAESPALWTNSPTVVTVVENYFRMKWDMTKEYHVN